MFKTLIVTLSLFSHPALSQTLISPGTLNMGGGSAAITPAFIVDWSIGESTIIETFTGKNTYINSFNGLNWNVTSGILQPFDKVHIIHDYRIPSWTVQEVRFYPVPTPKIVFIDFRSSTTGKITMQLLSSNLKLLGIKEFTHTNSGSKQSWNLSNQPSGVYYLKITLVSGGAILKQGIFPVQKIK